MTLKEAICEKCNELHDHLSGDYALGYNSALDDILSFVTNYPDEAADVQEVKHGKWYEDRFGNGITVPFGKYYVCNQCNHTSQKKSRYCAYCGAKMVERSKGNGENRHSNADILL